MKKLSKSQAKEKIEEFFEDLKNKTPNEIKKIKKLAMKHNIKLGEKRKLFCKKCLVPYENSKMRVIKGMKVVTCLSCKNVSRWKLM